MKFKFKIQQYQTDAVEQTVNVFAGQPSKTDATGTGSWHDRAHSSRVGFFFACFLAIRKDQGSVL